MFMNNLPLYERITTASEDESFRNIFQSLNLSGFQYLEAVETDDDTRNKIVRFVCYSYSFQSSLLQPTKDRNEVKQQIARKVGLKLTDQLTKDIFKMQDENVNQFVKWYLDENYDPLWATYISGLDFVADQLQFVREGLKITYTGDNPKAAANFIKAVKKDSDLKSKAFFAAREAVTQLEADKRELDKRHNPLEKILKEEMPSYFNGSMNTQEVMVKRFRNRNNNANNTGKIALEI